MMVRRSSTAWKALVACSTLIACAQDETSAPDRADRLAFRSAPAAATAGADISPAVQVVALRDDGSIATGATVEVTLSALPTAGVDTLRGETTIATSGGVATFTGVALRRAGAGMRLVAEAPGVTGAISAPFAVIPGPVAALAFVSSPDTTTAGQTLPAVRVEARDASGNRVASAAGPVTLSIATGPPGASLAGTVTVDLLAGEATFSQIRLPRAGTGYTLQATLVGSAVGPAVSRTFVNRPGAAAQLAFVVDPSGALAGQPIVPAIEVGVFDAFGNAVTSAAPTVTLSLATAPSGFVLGGALSMAATAGVARFADVRPSAAAGTVRLRAAATGLAPAVSAVFGVAAALQVSP